MDNRSMNTWQAQTMFKRDLSVMFPKDTLDFNGVQTYHHYESIVRAFLISQDISDAFAETFFTNKEIPPISDEEYDPFLETKREYLQRVQGTSAEEKATDTTYQTPSSKPTSKVLGFVGLMVFMLPILPPLLGFSKAEMYIVLAICSFLAFVYLDGIRLFMAIAVGVFTYSFYHAYFWYFSDDRIYIKIEFVIPIIIALVISGVVGLLVSAPFQKAEAWLSRK